MNLLRIFSPSTVCRVQNMALELVGTRRLATAQPAVDSKQKDAVREVRRRTGYSFAHIKKALEQHNWDITESEKWLKAEAKRLGWEKATGLASRVSKQGLIGVLDTDQGVTMVELNCETDFVAKNKRFHNLLASICHSAAKSDAIKGKTVAGRKWIELCTQNLSGSKTVVSSSCATGTIADLIASEVGHIGENIQLRRGLFWPKQLTKDSAVAFMTHPVSTMAAVVDTDLGSLNVGKYAAIIETRRVAQTTPPEDEVFEQLPVLTASQQLAQHVIGMNPDKIVPVKSVEKEEGVEKVAETSAPPANDGEPKAAVADQKQPRDDRALICQSFVLDEDITVGEFLEEQSLEVVDFVRFEVGEQ